VRVVEAGVGEAGVGGEEGEEDRQSFLLLSSLLFSE
jgi:hypothetical protein